MKKACLVAGFRACFWQMEKAYLSAFLQAGIPGRPVPWEKAYLSVCKHTFL